MYLCILSVRFSSTVVIELLVVQSIIEMKKPNYCDTSNILAQISKQIIAIFQGFHVLLSSTASEHSMASS